MLSAIYWLVEHAFVDWAPTACHYNFFDECLAVVHHYPPISGITLGLLIHIRFCPRQCARIVSGCIREIGFDTSEDGRGGPRQLDLPADLIAASRSLDCLRPASNT